LFLSENDFPFLFFLPQTSGALQDILFILHIFNLFTAFIFLIRIAFDFVFPFFQLTSLVLTIKGKK